MVHRRCMNESQSVSFKNKWTNCAKAMVESSIQVQQMASLLMRVTYLSYFSFGPQFGNKDGNIQGEKNSKTSSL